MLPEIWNAPYAAERFAAYAEPVPEHGIRFRESDSLTGGDRLTVLAGAGDPLATGLAEPPNLGLLICYDIRFPELALLMQQQLGATVIACPAAFNSSTGPRHWHLLLRARAVDTQCFVLGCSSARPEDGEGYPSYGHSLVVDPWGTVIAEAGTGEQVLHAQLDLAQVALARRAIPTSQQRRHDLYRLRQLEALNPAASLAPAVVVNTLTFPAAGAITKWPAHAA